jgi:hypothetical protein
MSLPPFVSIALIVALAACNPASHLTAASSPQTMARPRDIVAVGTGVTLGQGWYRFETYGGQSFRWVSNDARLVVRHPAGSTAHLELDVEPGPGLGQGVTHFDLFVRAANGNVVARVPVAGKQAVDLNLPVQPGKDATFTLHVAGGGRHIAGDPRVLDFRVFRIATATGTTPEGPDISSDPNLVLGDNWYPLEHFGGETFRWVDNDAQLIVNSDRAQTRRLKIVAAAGPSIKSPGNFMLALRDKKSETLQAGKIKARGTLYFSLPLAAGSNTFALHADSTGKKAPNDPRVLDFRVFSLGVQ